MEETRIPFRPVRCKESDLEKITPINGHVVFTTDTRKIFVVIDNEFKMMGGSSGIFYGQKTLTEEEKYGDQVIFSFLPSEIDGEEIPQENDLILNIPDGGFYRVLEVSNVDIQAQRIAVSGGGGGGSGPSNEGTLLIDYIPEKTPKESSTITGVPYYIYFKITAKDSAGDLVLDEGTATWMINGKQYTQKVKNGENSFRVDEYLDPTQDRTKIVLMLSMNTGGTTNSVVSKTWYVKAVSLSLNWQWNYIPSNYILNDTFTLSFTPNGGVDCKAHFLFDNNYNPGVTYFTKDIKANETGRLVYSDPIPSLPYGSHTCEMYLTATINKEEYRTESIKNELTFIKDGTSTILTVPYYISEVTQYDTLKIPFMVYDPTLESCNVSFYVNDNQVGGDSYSKELQYWPYTLTNSGSIKLTIKTDNEESKKDIELMVNKLDLDVEETKGYNFSLKAKNFSSNNELRDWNYNGITLSFSDNFDWDNGGLKFEEKADGSIEKFICVRQGTRMTINHEPFAAMDVASTGKNIKVCFKTANCYDYSAPVLECYDESSKVGIKLNAQQALFSSATFSEFSTQYYENVYIELETEIWPNIEDIDPEHDLYGDRFMMFWMDGIPAGVKPYPTNENFIHPEGNRKKIVVGSDLCDVYLYVCKVYPRRLTEDEHLDNFIMDAPSTEEMLKRYRRNDILDNTGEISYTRLVEQNPDCHVYMYEMDHMTTSKDDKVKDCVYTELFGEYNSLDNPYYSATGAEVYVQGTSSAAYGAAAFNLRSKFKSGLIDCNGEQVNGWQVTNEAIPIDLACTKVNVASCENANNVVNQEWYNKYQPYHDAHRRKTDKAYRDTMQFESGVVFVKDNNPNGTYIATEGKLEDKTSNYLKANCFLDSTRNGIPYYKNPYYKMYAIGNMGNDKKNIEVFHDTTNSKACCVEIADNQNSAHWMTTTIDMDQFNLEKPYHEFRYPDGNDKASTELKQAWIDFVDWMAHCDPSPYNAEEHPYGYTGEALENPVTYGVYTFKGFNPPGYENAENPTGITLKGTKITQFAGTYTHDTYEYRIAKMLNECEDHLVMDSVMFHYLFIQRHTMVDNVAKNTFWSTEDLVHWDLTKDYDNDTSDGNNNSGYLTFTYGIENLDKINGADVFNASDSVWIRFVHALAEGQQKMHQDLANKGAWDAQPYLDEFRRHQDKIPERCWIYDYFRKYIRPRRLGLDKETFLNRLEGGKKTHQRNQYENYQEFYLNSKYLAGTAFTDSSSIDMRLNKKPSTSYIQCSEDSVFSNAEIYYVLDEYGVYTQVEKLTEEEFNSNKTLYYILQGSWDVNNVITVSFYTDCYASIHVGGQKHKSGRLVRGQTYDLPVGTMIQSANDSTCYIYGAAMIQTLSGLSQTYPSYARLANAGKLRRIEYGSDAAGYYNPNLTSLDIDSNKMLQYVQAQNSGSSKGIGAAELKNTHQLQTLLLDGSTLKSLTLPTDGIIETLKLNALTALSMSNLNKLINVEVDEAIYTSMNNLTVKNCPMMDEHTYKMALYGDMTNYQLVDFKWTIDTLEGLVIDENDKVTGITVVDKLMTKIPNGGSKAAALIGEITIDINCNIDEFEIYKKYCTIYPNLIIKYTETVEGLDPAIELKFMTGEGVTAQVHYRVLGSGESDGDSIGKLISVEGPLELAMTEPNKESTSDTTYTFTGYWLDSEDNRYYQAGLADPESEATCFDDIIPIENMTFYPEFITKIREYEVKFYDNSGKVIQQNGKDYFLVPYGSTYAGVGGPMTNFYYLDSSKLPDNQRYSFKGWSTNKYETGEVANPVYFDLEHTVVKNSILLYPHYIIEDVYKVATSGEYFDINQYGRINLRSEYKTNLAGKITIPTQINNITVKSIGSMGLNSYNSTSELTHVYFLPDSQVEKIEANAFSYCNNLKIVDLPLTIRTIDNSAFAYCVNLLSITLNDNITVINNSAFESCKLLEINKLPDALTSLGGSAFQSCGEGIRLTSLPTGVVYLGNFTFNSCKNVKLIDLSQIQKIGAGCFKGAGSGAESVIIGEFVDFQLKIGESPYPPFAQYGEGTLNSVYFKGSEEDYPSMGELGFRSDIDCIYGYDSNSY